MVDEQIWPKGNSIEWVSTPFGEKAATQEGPDCPAEELISKIFERVFVARPDPLKANESNMSNLENSKLGFV